VDLRKIERALAEMAAQCEGGTVPKCPILDALLDRPQDTADEPPRSPASSTVFRRRRNP
jgi:MerR family mercuric resistance operon transcriptional regulator